MLNTTTTRTLNRLLIIGLVGIFLFCLLLIVDKYAAQRTSLINTHWKQLELQKSQLQKAITELGANLRLLAANDDLAKCLPNECLGTAFDRHAMSFLTLYKHYTQLRIFSLGGDELLRWDYNRLSNFAYPVRELQNKSNRYYFNQALRLEPGEVYFSALDYNSEQGALTLPLMPTIRALVKVEINGQPYIIGLNYDPSDAMFGTTSINNVDWSSNSEILFVAEQLDQGTTDIPYGDVYPLYRSYDEIFSIDEIDLPLLFSQAVHTPAAEESVANSHTFERSGNILLTHHFRLVDNKLNTQSEILTVVAYLPLQVVWSNFFTNSGNLFSVVIVLLFTALAAIVKISRTSKMLFAREDMLEQTVEKLSKSERELKLKAETQAQIFAVIGHELRTPMASIKMMQDDMKLREIEPHGADICRTVESSIEILEDLRLIAQPERAKLVKQVIDNPYNCIERTLASINSITTQRHLHINFHANSASNRNYIFAVQPFRQIVTNLVKNAAVHANASECCIELRCLPTDSEEMCLTVEITDNGKGIPLEQQQRLFKAFERGNTDADGTGLGLFITKELAQQLGGDIEYFSPGTQGAGFRFHCALQPAPDAHTEQRDSKSESLLSGMRVLVAEDQLTLNKLTVKQLEVAGAQVTPTFDGVEALLQLKTQEFDLLLTDINMPQMNGYQLTQEARALGFTGLIVGVTAATIGRETDKLIESGADGVVSKPITMKALNSLLTELRSAC